MKEFEYEKVNRELLSFLDRSPVPFFAVRNMKEMLAEAGFQELKEGDRWELTAGGSYYVSRNDSALIAFRIPRADYSGFQIMASHCDSPLFKIKTNAEIEIDRAYVKLNVEKYGGALCAPWLDRPLSVAGRVVVETEKGIETRLINIDRDLLIIPNLAIHMNREANDGYQYNVQRDMLPLFSGIGEGEFPTSESDGSFASEPDRASASEPDRASASEPDGSSAGREKDDWKPSCEKKKTAGGRFSRLIADEAGVPAEKILDADLFLYNRMKGTVLGLNGEFISSGRLDDLQCAFASLKGIIQARPQKSVAVHCVYDNEEVGSGTRQGAGGTFLRDVLGRINAAFGRSREEYLRSLVSSFMVSADNAHSVHPNHAEKTDPTNRPRINGGIVIKYSANQKYTTDAVSGAIFRTICKKAGVPYQVFLNRSDMLGGSTLGNISQSQVSLSTVDIGLAQLAMHSPYETAGARDTAWLVEAARVLFSGSVLGRGDGTYELEYLGNVTK